MNAPALTSRFARIAWASYVLGVAFRAAYILRLHPPIDYLFSDMASYYETGQRILGGTEVAYYDALFPPGVSYLVALTRSHVGYAFTTLLLSCAVPLILRAAATLAFGARAGAAALVMASLYVGFVDQAAYVSSEGPAIFLLAFAAFGMASFVAAHRMGAPLVSAAAMTGLAFGTAACFRGNASIPALFVLAAFTARASRRTLVCAAFAVAFAVPVGAASVRATRLSGGEPRFVSSNGPMNVLLGHRGRDFLTLHWQPPGGSGLIVFGSPSAVARGYTGELHVPFAAWDVEANLAEASRYARAHPFEVVTQSFEHVADTLSGSIPFPTGGTRFRSLAGFGEQQHLLVLWPALVTCLYLAVVRRRARAEVSMFVLPFAGNLLTVALTVGEPRFRIPFDVFTMVLAAGLVVGALRAPNATAPP